MKLTDAALHAMMPRAATIYTSAMVETQQELADVGVLDTVDRASFLFANIAQESGEFHEMVENINYSPARACAVWPSRFHSISEVYSKTRSYPGDPNFNTKLMDVTYGGRMGNRPGTHDGSTYIGRGPLQLTGRDEYDWAGKATGLDLVSHPEIATQPQYLNKITAVYVKQRGLNAIADSKNFIAYVKRINGGTIGLADRQAYLRHIQPIMAALADGKMGGAPDQSIALLQKLLNDKSGFDLMVDGVMGPATSLAIKKFQTDHGLVADGIAGPITWAALDALP